MKKETSKLLFIVTALLTLVISATIIYGWNVILIAGVAVASALLVEYLFAVTRKKTFNWLPAIITALVVALLLPPTSPWWLVLIASSFALFFGKAVFGGHGTTVFNPALTGLVFVIVSFPLQMLNSFVDPTTGVVSPTNTATLALGGNLNFTNWQLLVGNTPDLIGTSSRLILLGILLVFLIFKVVDWKIVLGYVGMYLLTSLVFWLTIGGTNPIGYFLSGGVVFGAVFLVTEPYSAAQTPIGKYVYGALAGFLVYFISRFTSYADGLVFALLLANISSPLIDLAFQPRSKEGV